MSIREYVREAIQATPPSATVGLSLFGIALNHWATMLSLIVLAVQLYFMIKNQRRKDRDYKEYLDRRSNGDGSAGSGDPR